MVELVDTSDLKSDGPDGPCGFDPRFWYCHRNSMVEYFRGREEVWVRFPPVALKKEDDLLQDESNGFPENIREIVEHLRGWEVEIDRPLNEDGTWWIDARRRSPLTHLVIAWNPEKGFGLTIDPGPDYSTLHDEVFDTESVLRQRLEEL